MGFDQHRYKAPRPPAKRPPPPPPEPKRCRYHASLAASGAVFVGDWILLCGACANAVRGHALSITDADGSYRGFLPPLTRPK